MWYGWKFIFMDRILWNLIALIFPLLTLEPNSKGNSNITLLLENFTPVHHHGIEPRPTSCYPHWIPPNLFPGMLICQCHTQTTWLHPRPHLPSVWNCIPTCPPIPTHPRSQHPLTPKFYPCPSGIRSFDSVSCILLLRKASVNWSKYSFSFSFISICLSDAHPQAGRRSRLS